MNITLNILQCCRNNSNGFQKVVERSYAFTSLSQSVPIMNCYNLSIINYTSSSVTISIQNDNETHIRIIHTSYPFEACFSSNNITFYIAISIVSLNV